MQETSSLPEWTPILPVIIGAAALFLALVVAARNRTLFRPRLSVHFRLPVEFHQKRAGWMKREPVALFVLNKPQAPTQIHLPIHIENNSRRKISDVSLELVYPRTFFVNNRGHTQNFDELLVHFPNREEEVNSLKHHLSKRTSRAAGELVFVTYDIGTLRPGQSEVFYESINLPSRDKSFTDERFEGTLFGEILQNLKEMPAIRGVCHVRGRLFSDLNRPTYAWINAVSAKGGPFSNLANHALADEIMEPYGAAHWLGRYPDRPYFGPRLPFPRAYRQPFSRRMTVDMIYPKLTHEARKLSDSFIAAIWFDGMGSSFGYGYVNLPGYDYFKLPRGISRDEALLSIGFGRIPNIRSPRI